MGFTRNKWLTITFKPKSEKGCPTRAKYFNTKARATRHFRSFPNNVYYYKVQSLLKTEQV